MYVIGIDPGPLPGLVRLQLAVHVSSVRLITADAMQVTPDMLLDVLDGLHGLTTAFGAVAVERFVVGQRAARSATARAGARTRDMVAEVTGWVRDRPSITLHGRSAAEVKPWAIDERLAAAGLLEPTKGMRHARDAARHALYCAVRDYGLPDPLSRVKHWGNGVGGVGLTEHKGAKKDCPAPECGT